MDGLPTRNRAIQHPKRTIQYTLLASLVLVLALIARGDQAPRLAPFRSAEPPFLTPACRQAVHQNEDELFASLSGADDACTEELALALATLASNTTVTRLLALLASPDNSLSRRNALRTLGRMAERPPGEPAHTLVLGARAADLRVALAQTLQRERNIDVLNDTIWILDTFLYPSFASQPDLERISADQSREPALRSRAIAAAGRLIYARPGHLSDGDLGFFLSSLASDDAGVRAQAALIGMRLRDEQLDQTRRARVVAALEEAWRADGQPVTVAPVITANPVELRAVLDQSVARISVSAALARALDRYSSGTHRLDTYQAAFEAAHLPHRQEAAGIVLRSGLPVAALPALFRRVERTQAAFFDLVGPALRSPTVGDPNETLTVLVFADIAPYRAYMHTFVNVPFEVDGVYVEHTGTLYTFQRTPEQTGNTLEESLQHEVGHYLTGRFLFPGSWFVPGYHTEPKGWVDEGLAEVLAGLVFDDAGGYRLPPHPRHVARMCAAPASPELARLLGQRTGYDRFGRFDYAYAWAFSYFLLTERPEVARRIYQAYRDGSYQLESFAAIAGVPSVAALEHEWHASMRGWCGRR